MRKWNDLTTIADRRVTCYLSAFDTFAQRHPREVVALLVGSTVWLVSFFLYAPPLWWVGKLGRLADFLSQCANPLERHLSEPILAYRITTPLIAWLLHLRGLEALTIQYVAHILMFSVIYLALQTRVNHRTAVLTCLAVSLTYVTQWPNTHPGYSDAVTHLAIAAALLAPNFIVVTLATTFGMLNDERFALAVPFIFFWHAGELRITKAVPENLGLLFGFVVGMSIVVIVRHALTVGWIGEGIRIPPVYSEIVEQAIFKLHPFKSTWPNFLISVLLSFRWVWIFPLMVLTQAGQGDHRWLRVGTLGCIILAIASSITVWDVARSIAFIFPVVLTSVWWMHRNQGELLCNRLLAAVIVLCIITPGVGYYGGVNTLRLFYPLPLVVIRTYFVN